MEEAKIGKLDNGNSVIEQVLLDREERYTKKILKRNKLTGLLKAYKRAIKKINSSN